MGREIFLELGHFDIHQKLKNKSSNKNFGFFLQEKLKNCILNEKFN